MPPLQGPGNTECQRREAAGENKQNYGVASHYRFYKCRTGSEFTRASLAVPRLVTPLEVVIILVEHFDDFVHFH